MYAENIVIGMKVIPFRKTAKGWGMLGSSWEWKHALEHEQRYLFITGYQQDEQTWILSEHPDNGANGDFFNSSDFKLYESDTVYEKADKLILDAKKELDDMMRGGNERAEMGINQYIRGLENMLDIFKDSIK